MKTAAEIYVNLLTDIFIELESDYDTEHEVIRSLMRSYPRLIDTEIKPFFERLISEINLNKKD
jgi:hypothetical protein